MRNIILTLFSIICIYSCSVPTNLYYWGKVTNDTSVYENLAYRTYDKQTPKSICDLICAYEDMINNPGGIRKMPPPGICAEYGYLLLKPETVSIFNDNASSRQRKVFKTDNLAAHFNEYGKELLSMEIQLYPESEKFIKPLLEKLK